MIPKLYITYAYPLDVRQRMLFVSKNFGEYPSMDEVRDKTLYIEKLWNELNRDDRVMKSLVKIIGTKPTHDLEMYIFGKGLTPMSSPLMMPIIIKRDGGIASDDEYTEVIIHELIHRFIQDGLNNAGIEKYFDMVRTVYASENPSTQNHILLYAVLEEVLIDLFGKERLKDFTNENIQYFPDYVRAVEIAREKGAKNLVEEFKSYLVA